MREKILIINADDYGYNTPTNSAIQELFERRCITSSSILAVGPCAADAVRTAAERGFSVGIHFAFNSDSEQERWHSLTPAPSLNDGQGLYADQKKLALRAKSRDIVREMEAQYRLLADGGCIPDHADSHCGTLFGVNGRFFFMDAFRFCAAHALPFSLPKSPRFLERQLGPKAARFVRPLHRRIAAAGLAMGVKLPDDMFSSPDPIQKIESYEALRAYYIRELRALEPGITELFLHPAHPVREQDAPDMEDSWTKRIFEFRLLQSGDLQQAARDAGFRVASWAEAFAG